ncbi:hypothetical protein TNCV_4028311 [Trichonephila clavipes]|nr:hypothetical protein TNCV_4028311 [Trichonephila clavipes]
MFERFPHPSEVGRKEFNVNRSSDCDVEMKVGVCEGRVKTVAMGAQQIDLPGKRDRTTVYRLNLIKLYRRKPELANLVMENSSEGIDSETLYSVKLFMDFGFQGFVNGILGNRWRDGQVCPDFDKELCRLLGQDGSCVLALDKCVSRCGQGTMAPWAKRLGCVWRVMRPIGGGQRDFGDMRIRRE